MTPEDFQRETAISLETLAKFRRYEALLGKWSRAINLVAKSTQSDVWRRHFLDSVQLWHYAPPNARRWLDLGSGGGFPGLAVAIIAFEKRPEMTFRLVESDRRKCAFLTEVSRETSLLNVEITCARVETISDQADVVTARAFAPLPKLLAYAAPLIADGGRALFLKGDDMLDELTAARRGWHIDAIKHNSVTDSTGTILEITNLRRESK